MEYDNTKSKLSYYQLASRSINGWVDEAFFSLLRAGAGYHIQFGVSGSMLEIGVFEGKSLLAFGQCLRGDEIIVGVDLFEDAALSADGLISHQYEQSLKNLSQKKTEDNISKFADDSSRYHLFKGFSRDRYSDVKNFLVKCGQAARMISIDGGHSAKDVLEDLKFADSISCDRSLLFVDDIFNPQWPGVMSATVAFLDENRERWTPVALGGNKLVITKSKRSDCMDFFCSNLRADIQRKDQCHFLGYEVLNLYS